VTIAISATHSNGPVGPGDGSQRTRSGFKWSGGWHIPQRQPFGSCRSVHHRVPKQELHHAPGVGGAVSAVLG
jgi:hypothetical protein